ncbi:MAG: TolC family protein [Candidatus Hydrogenedentes bacterium]|nr:TolC family protein [Candidatus Hydrogenedentota bacterium]
MSMLRAAAGALVVLIALSGCQHIPREPLHLDEIRAALEARPLDPDPVRAYAEELQTLTRSQTGPFDTEDGLSLAEAEALGLWYNADARRARLEADSAAARTNNAGRWPDPELLLGRGRQEIDGPDGVDRAWISEIGLAITVPISGRPRAERRYLNSEHAAALRAAEAAEWEVQSRIRETWIAWSENVERLALLDAHLDTLRPLYDMARALLNTGERSPTALGLILVDYDRTRARRALLEGASEEARLEVVHTLGLSPDAPITFLPSLAPDLALPDAPEVSPSHTVIAYRRAAYEAAEERLRLELRKQYPDITFSPLRTSDRDETALVLGLGAPIPVWNANRPGIAEAAAERDRARLEVEEAWRDLLAGLRRRQARHQASAAALETLLNGPARILDTQLAQALALLDAGELDLPLLYDVIRQTLETREQILQTRAENARAAAGIHAAIQTAAPLADPNEENAP